MPGHRLPLSVHRRGTADPGRSPAVWKRYARSQRAHAHADPASASRSPAAQSSTSQVRSRIRRIRIGRGPGGVPLSARSSTRSAALSRSTSRLLPASNSPRRVPLGISSLSPIGLIRSLSYPRGPGAAAPLPSGRKVTLSSSQRTCGVPTRYLEGGRGYSKLHFGATIRQHTLPQVAADCRIGLDKPIRLLAVAHGCCVLRPGWCQKWCQFTELLAPLSGTTTLADSNVDSTRGVPSSARETGATGSAIVLLFPSR